MIIKYGKEVASKMNKLRAIRAKNVVRLCEMRFAEAFLFICYAEFKFCKRVF